MHYCSQNILIECSYSNIMQQLEKVATSELYVMDILIII